MNEERDKIEKLEGQSRQIAYVRLEEECKKELCNGKEKQPSNITKSQQIGLKSLRKRVKDKSLIIMRTDKSNKFAVTTLENYLKMGEKHISTDREISLNEIAEREQNL